MNNSDEYPTCAAPDCDRPVSDDDSEVCDDFEHRVYDSNYDPHERIDTYDYEEGE